MYKIKMLYMSRVLHKSFVLYVPICNGLLMNNIPVYDGFTFRTTSVAIKQDTNYIILVFLNFLSLYKLYLFRF